MMLINNGQTYIKRLEVLEKFKLDSSNTYNTSFTLHVGGGRIMTPRVDSNILDTGLALVRSRFVGGASYNLLKADTTTSRDNAFQMHITENRAWVKNADIIASLTSPETTSLNSRLTALEARVLALEQA